MGPINSNLSFDDKQWGLFNPIYPPPAVPLDDPNTGPPSETKPSFEHLPSPLKTIQSYSKDPPKTDQNNPISFSVTYPDGGTSDRLNDCGDSRAYQKYILKFYEMSRYLELSEAQKKFNTDIGKLINKIEENKRFISDIKKYKDNADQVLKLFDNNKDLFLTLLKLLLAKNEINYDTLDFYRNIKEELIKSFEFTIVLILNIWPLLLINQYKEEAKQLAINHKKVLDNFSTSQHALTDLNNSLATDHEKRLKKIKQAYTETALLEIIPWITVFLWNNFDYKKILKPSKLLIKTIKKFKKINDIIENYTLKGKRYQALKPSQIPEKFKHDYFNDNETFPSITQNLKDKFDSRVEKKLNLLNYLIDEKSNLDFNDFSEELSNHVFKINDLEKLKNCWENKSFPSEYKQEICKRAVDYQMTSAQLLKQGTQAALLTKLNVESQLLIFNSIKAVAECIYTLAQIALIVPYLGNLMTKYGGEKILQILIDDLPIKGLPVLCFLNPDFDLSLFAFIVKGISHLWGQWYKPHEYSLNGYLIDSKIKWTHIFYNATYLLLCLTKLTFHLMDIIIEFVLNTNINKTDSYQKLNNKLEDNRKKYDLKIKQLEEMLNELKKTDIKKTLNPEIDLSSSLNKYKDLRKYLIENNCPTLLIKKIDIRLKNHKDLDDSLNAEIDRFLGKNYLYTREKILSGETKYHFDALNIIIETLEAINVDELPEELTRLLKENARTSLDTGNIRDQLEELFISSDKAYFKSYKEEPASAAN